MGIQERREREKEARRAAVLNATRSLVLERGFNATTTKIIAEQCELSEGALFLYFQNKEEIFLSLLFEGIDFTATVLDKLIAADLPPTERVQKLWDSYTLINREHPEYVHVFGYLSRPQATATVSAEVKANIARKSGDNFRRVARFLEGVVPRDRTRIAADLLWAAFIGLNALNDTRRNLGAPAHPTKADFKTAFDLITRGLQADGAGGARP
jgi:AcrR family transcriptional regulator